MQEMIHCLYWRSTTSNINLHGRANVIFKTGGSSYDGGTERMRIEARAMLGIKARLKN